MPGGCVVRNEHFETLNETRYLPTGSYYEIPYRCIVPRTIDNLLVSGRCISADHVALSSLRVIGTCFAIAEAAGTAAFLALQQSVTPRALDGQKVRAALMTAGVPL